MSKKFLTISVVILLIMNLGMLGFLFFGPHVHNKKHEPTRLFIINKLNLNEDQIAKYDDLIEEHSSSVIKREQQIKKLKSDTYQYLKGKSDGTEKDSNIEKIVQIQREIEHIHLKHFQDIKAILNDDQLPRFEELVDELARLFNTKFSKKK